jgi:hypothetical protein
LLPGQPENPSLLVCDTSSLIQLIIAERTALLHTLRNDYRIQAVVVEAVEAELRRNIERRFTDKANILKKALNSKSIVVLDEAVLEANGFRAANALLEQIDELGADFALRIDRGEAYTHSAAQVLTIPTLSQDLRAISKLIQDKVRVARPILRAFDVILFGLQIGELTIGDCNTARRVLLKRKEAVLSCFANCSIETDWRSSICGLPTPPKRSQGLRVRLTFSTSAYTLGALVRKLRID